MSEPLTSSAETPAPNDVFRRLLSRENRYLPRIFATLLLIVVHWTFGLLEGYGPILLAIGSSILTEAVLGRLILGHWPRLVSAYMTGISVGILIRSPYYWPFALCSMISITSKYVIRWRGRHIWNPSNLGVSAMLFLAPATVASLSIQWSNSLWPMLVIWWLGAWIVWRVGLLHITATYVVSFLAFSAVRSSITGYSWLAEIAPLTGPMYQLFIFFMLTDPKTIVQSRRGQCLVAFLIAFVEMLIRLMGDVHAPYYALFLVGPVAMVVDLWLHAPRQVELPIPAPALETS